MMLTARNLSTILDQTMITLVVACGTLFVVAQGSTDLSVGVNLALAGVIGSYVASVSGIAWLMIPVTLAVGALMGWLNGFLVARCKVSSFMVTLAMLIGVRGLVNYLQVFTEVQRLPDARLQGAGVPRHSRGLGLCVRVYKARALEPRHRRE